MISAVIPVYRGSNSLYQLYTRLISQKDVNEVLFVFDYGHSESWDILKDICSKNANVKAIKLSRNFGQHNAIICGILESKERWIVTLDEDLQHQPEEIALLVEKQKERGSDVVYGKYEILNHSGFRNITSRFMKWLLKFSIPNLHQDYSAFRLIKTETAKKMISMQNSYTFLDGYLSWLTASIDSVKVSHHTAESGKSSYSIKKLIEHSINIFITFSNLPIRILTVASFIFILFSFSYSIYIIITSILIKDYNAGFPTFIVFMGFGFGLILFGMGIIGEYIARINYKTTKRPNFIIDSIVEGKN